MLQRVALVVGGALCVIGASAVHAQPCPTPVAVTTACTGSSCAVLDIGDANGNSTTAGTVEISFSQAPDNGQAQSGADDVAAIAFTVGMPGTGSGEPPLVFDCVEGALAAGAVEVDAAIADTFQVVVENAQCTNRNRCLCPTGDGQQRDDFVNLAVYGPKTLPEQGPVTIPALPDSGVLVRLNLKAAEGATGMVPLKVFSALDATRPQFAANLSIGDQSACDVSATEAGVSTVQLNGGTFTIGGVTPPPTGCVGDCNTDGSVAINELIIGVNIALGSTPVGNCSSFDVNSNGSVEINELISAVNNALNGCPS